MLLLTSTSDLLRIITGSAADVEVHASYVDNAAGTITPGRTNTPSITTATTTTVVGSPGASVQRNVKLLNVHNNHASVSTTVGIEHTDGTTVEMLWNGTLAASEIVIFDAVGNWTTYDSVGLVKASAYPIATQADMEAASGLVTFVAPGLQHFHPSAAKFWVTFTGNSTTITASYNMTSITDGTSEATVTIATDFSSSAWNIHATAIGTATSAAAVRLACARAMAAGSVIVFCVDGAATTALQDPTTWCVTGFGDH